MPKITTTILTGVAVLATTALSLTAGLLPDAHADARLKSVHTAGARLKDARLGQKARLGQDARLGTPAATASPVPYHIKNSAPSQDFWGVDPLVIWTGTNCTGTKHTLQNGQTATSSGWNSYQTAYGDPAEVTIRDTKTGAVLKSGVQLAPAGDNEQYGQCKRAYPGHSDFVNSYYGS